MARPILPKIYTWREEEPPRVGEDGLTHNVLLLTRCCFFDKGEFDGHLGAFQRTWSVGGGVVVHVRQESRCLTSGVLRNLAFAFIRHHGRVVSAAFLVKVT